MVVLCCHGNTVLMQLTTFRTRHGNLWWYSHCLRSGGCPCPPWLPNAFLHPLPFTSGPFLREPKHLPWPHGKAAAVGVAGFMLYCGEGSGCVRGWSHHHCGTVTVKKWCNFGAIEKTYHVKGRETVNWSLFNMSLVYVVSSEIHECDEAFRVMGYHKVCVVNTWQGRC